MELEPPLLYWSVYERAVQCTLYGEAGLELTSNRAEDIAFMIQLMYRKIQVNTVSNRNVKVK